MSILTRDEILALDDIETKQLTIPNHIRGWGGKQIVIRQLTRGQQDEYLRRQFGSMKMRQDAKSKQQELSAAQIYGHDAWLCARGIVDPQSNRPIFSDQDLAKLNEKNGEAIGWIATQIVEFSGMQQDVDQIKSIEDAENDIKN
jgi:hypothetical protein